MIKNVFGLSFILFFLFGFKAISQNPSFYKLSNRARVSVISTSPGEDLYTVFGHAAIRIQDSLSQQDWVYGYGEFDFNTPNFYPEFVRGSLLYTISKDPFPLFKSEFLSEPYQMKEQVLNLDSNQKQKIFSILETNTLPQNRLYRYDFFYDNCATRIRDVLNKSIPNSSLFSTKSSKSSPTFRDLIKIYLVDRPWIQLGTDLILGIPADKHLSPYEQTFLPFYLSQYIGAAYLPNHKPLVKSESYILVNKSKRENISFLSPGACFWLFFMFSLLGLFFQNMGKIISTAIFTLIGILGIIILYLWLGTERTTYGFNLNCLWASPLHLVLPFLKRKRVLSIILLSLIFVFYISALLQLQIINPAVIPISLTLLVYISQPFYPLLNALYKEDTLKDSPH